VALWFDMATNPPDSIPDDQATSTPDDAYDAASAADLIRGKLDRIYAEEPAAEAELAEAEAVPRRSRHQQFMYDLSTSGKDLAAVQTEWHTYYQDLPAEDKHQVWQEFYASQSLLTGQPAAETAQVLAEHKQQATDTGRSKARAKAGRAPKLREARSKRELQSAIRDKVSAGGKLETKHHLQSLLFGLGAGLIVILIFLFGFFNEVIIAPFIQPSRASASTPLIVSTDSVAPSSEPQVIIPKINVQIPVVYGQASIDENVLQNALESGVVHYPTTTVPGQTGNAAYFGHSSNNIFNKGKYKFAFVMLHNLVEGDTFYLTYQGKVYVYKVISKTVVDPDNVGVLNPVPGQTATATLITCDPPGTSLRRLVVVGQQISPDPSGNAAAAATPATDNAPASLPGNGPTLLGRLLRNPLGRLAAGLIVAVSLLFAVRWLTSKIGR
jgi:sortase A